MEKWRRVTVEPVKRYPDHTDSHYNTQNVLVRQHNFPVAVHVADDNEADGDFIGCGYEDRVPYEVRDRAMKLIPRKQGGYPECSMEHYLKTCNPDKFMAFCENIMREWCGLKGRKLTGAGVVLFTNVSNGYPCLRFDVVIKHNDTPEEDVDKGFVDPRHEMNEFEFAIRHGRREW